MQGSRLTERSGHVDVLPETKDRQYFAELIVELEKRLDVNEIRSGEVRLWPLIRWELARNIKGVEVDDSISDSVKDVRANRFAGGREERLQVATAARDKERAANPDPHVQIRKQLDMLETVGACDYLVFSKIEKYYQPIGERFYAPITDPIYEDLCKRGKTRSIALEPLDIDCVNEPIRLSIDPYMRISGAIQKLPADPSLLRGVENVNRVLADISPNYHLDARRLINRINRYRRRVPFFRDILETLRPKAIFCSSFVGWAPLIWAARQVGVVSVDIQHGGQSPYHYHTTHWTRLPEEGYELLPDVFWVWGTAIKNYIDPWLPGRSVRHVPVVGGHRYVAKWINDDDDFTSDSDAPHIADLVERKEKTVLVTLGYSVKEILPDHVVEAIRRTPDWLWLLRLHPINRGQAAIREIETKTVKSGIGNVEYMASTRLPLYSLMRLSDFHVTPFSTTCREARSFGLNSAIVHPIGKTYFKNEIEQGTFDYAGDAETLLFLIENKGWKSDAKDQLFIETADSLVDEVLRATKRMRSNF